MACIEVRLNPHPTYYSGYQLTIWLHFCTNNWISRPLQSQVLTQTLIFVIINVCAGAAVNLTLVTPEKAIKLAANDFFRHQLSRDGWALLFGVHHTVMQWHCEVLIPASVSPAVGWRSPGRCWPVAVQECAKSSSPHPWRCSRSSCRTLADLVIRKMILKQVGHVFGTGITICSLSSLAAQQRVLPSVVTTLKMGGTSTVLSRSYNTSPLTKAMRVSATQITRELLRTKGVRALYRGLGATLMRSDKILLLFWICSSVSSLLTWLAWLFTFQGYPIFRCVLPPVCTSSQAWSAFAWGSNGAVLLVVHVWMLGWMCGSCSCESLWWWAPFFALLYVHLLELWCFNW